MIGERWFPPLAPIPRPVLDGSDRGDLGGNCVRVRSRTALTRSRISALSRAFWHDFSGSDAHEASDLNEQDKGKYARDRMAEIIDRRTEILSSLLTDGYFDHETGARSRAASELALLDESRESILARKSEAMTKRGLFRTLREFREVKAAAGDIRPWCGGVR